MNHRSFLQILAGVFILSGVAVGLYVLVAWFAPSVTSAFDAGLLADPRVTGVVGLVVGGLVVAWWRRGSPVEVQRHQTQVEVYTHALDTLAMVLELPPPEAVEDAPDDVQQAVAEVLGEMRIAERHLQLHAGHRVLAAYRAIRAAAETDRLPTTLLNDLVVEMRRDLGGAVYSEIGQTVLGFETQVPEALHAIPPEDAPASPGDGAPSSPRSSAIASSLKRS